MHDDVPHNTERKTYASYVKSHATDTATVPFISIEIDEHELEELVP